MRKTVHTKAYAAFQALLRGQREARGILQTELSELLGRSQSYVSKCESGDRRLDVIELREWCVALGVPFGEFARKLEKRLSKGL